MKVISNETLVSRLLRKNPITHTHDMLRAQFWGTQLFIAPPLSLSKLISYSIESFTAGLLTHGSPSAYPADRSRPLLPLSISFAWDSEQSDEDFVTAMKETARTITVAADEEGQDIGDAILYGNYALAGTPISRIYGNNLPRLKALKGKYDPDGIMDLAGGWKV